MPWRGAACISNVTVRPFGIGAIIGPTIARETGQRPAPKHATRDVRFSPYFDVPTRIHALPPIDLSSPVGLDGLNLQDKGASRGAHTSAAPLRLFRAGAVYRRANHDPASR